jgi:hypothetical protein
VILEVEITDRDWALIAEIAGIPARVPGGRLDLGLLDYPVDGWSFAGSVKRAYREKHGTALPG